jgi:hypothetical protein
MSAKREMSGIKASILNWLSIFSCIVPVISVLIIVPSVLQNPTGYVTAFLLFILVLLLYMHLAQKEAAVAFSRHLGLKSSLANFAPFARIDLVILLMYIAAVMAVMIIPPDYSLYLDWSGIPFSNWMRLIAGFLLTSFLPGYVILKTIDSKRTIKGAASLVFSFLLSFFITTVIGLALELTGNKISQYGLSTLVMTSISFIVLLLFSNFRYNRRKQEYSAVNSHHDKNYLQILILLCLVVLQCSLLYTVFFTNQSFLRGDMWSHFADVSNLLKYGFETQSTLSGYFWGYRIFNGVFLILGGFPLINTEITLVFLYPISIIAFYSMVSILFKSSTQKVPIIATVIWTTFSGFDWSYLFSQGLVPGKFSFNAVYPIASKTMSGVIYPYATFGYDHLPFVVSMISVFMLLYLFKYSKLETTVRVSLITVTTLLGYLVHSTEVMLFIILFIPFLLIFSKEESIAEVRKGLVSMLLGLVGVLFLDFSAPSEPVYTTTYGLPLSIALVCVAIPLTYVLGKISLRKNLSKILTYKRTHKLLVLSSLVLCYLYFLSFIMLSSSPLSSRGFSIGTLQRVIPWFAYPLRLGCAGILLLASIFYIAIKRKFSEMILFCLAVIGFSIIFGRLYAIVYPIEVATTHDRIFYIMFVAVSIAAAWIVPKIFSKIRESNLSSSSVKKISRNFLASLFLVVIVIGGSLSTIISSEYWAAASGPFGLPQNNMPQDIAALSYLKTNSPSLSTVVTNDISTDSIQAEVASLASVQTLDSDQFDTWFGTTQPEVLFAMKNLLNVSCVYLSSGDLTAISEIYPRSYFINHLIKYLPKMTFANSNVSIYKMPALYPPSGNNLSIVIPSTTDENVLLSVDTFAYSGLQYNLHLQQDSDKFEASTLVLPFDPTPPDWPGNSIMVASGNQTDFWIPSSWGYGSINTPTISSGNTTQDGIDYLNIFVGNGSAGRWGIYHDYSPTVDWSGKETFCVYWNGTNSGCEFTIEIRTPDASNQHIHSFKDDFLGWKEIVVPFSKFNDLQSGTFDLSRIGRIYIYPSSYNVPSTYQIGPVFVSRPSHYLTQSEIAEYTNWLKDGGHLVVFDNWGNGYFARMFGLRTTGNGTADGIASQKASISIGAINITEVAMDDPNTAAIANYTINGRSISPFAISKSFGMGQITYVMTKSFYDAMATTGDETLKASMFSNINLTSFFDISSAFYCQPTDYQMLSPTRIGISATTGNFSGAVEINSTSFVFGQTKFDVLVFKSTDSVLVGGNTSNLATDYELSNVTLLGLTMNGSSTLTIAATKAQIGEHQIFPGSLSDFLPLTFADGFNMELAVPNETSVIMNLEVNNSVLSVVAKGGILSASTSNVNSSILLDGPSITVRGKTFFDKAWFRRPYSVYQSFVTHGSLIELDGTTSFEVPLSESGKVYLSSFKFTGTYKVFQKDLSLVSLYFSYDAWEINLLEILLSPLNILLVWNILLVVYIIIQYLKLNGVHFIPLNGWKTKKNLYNSDSAREKKRED